MLKILLFLVLARLYGDINGLASGSCSSATTLDLGEPDTIASFFRPDGALGILLPSLLLTATRHSLLVSATHVPGCLSYIADALSRSQMPYVATYPLASPVMTHFSGPLLEELNSLSSISEQIASLLSAWLGPFALHNAD